MGFHFFRDGLLNKICVKSGMKMLFFRYLPSLMTETRKHSVSFASGISGIGIPSFGRFLCGNERNTVSTMNDLPKKQARIYSRALNASKKAPQKVFVPIDDVLQKRCSPKSENVRKFGHGHGFAIGHQWTDIILFFSGKTVPQPPVPFYTEKYCREKNIRCRTSHQRLAEYIDNLNLNEYAGRLPPVM